MLKQILSKFLILNDVQAAIVIQENGEIIQSMKSGMREVYTPGTRRCRAAGSPASRGNARVEHAIPLARARDRTHLGDHRFRCR